MMVLKKDNLIKIISNDIFQYGSIQLLLLIIIMISAILVITVSHKTRVLTIYKNVIITERESLDTEWRNLILEENALGNHSRIERISTEKLQMIHVDPIKENIVIEK
ncbi:MAG: cell division protein FtsL [Arsenophonus sp.]|nr:MAG: cell division protein FtsL [Arsenophonus sp.]